MVNLVLQLLMTIWCVVCCVHSCREATIMPWWMTSRS